MASLQITTKKTDLQRLNSAGNESMLETHNRKNKTEKMHLERAAGEMAGNVVEADHRVTDVKHVVRHGGAPTCVVYAGYDCMQYSLLNLSTHTTSL